ncbi:MAG: phytanoyl-CoA dioxygenase family protein, partial [Alphaproteobacteria bacterium]
MLTEQQIEFFHANGYLVVENAVSAEQLDALRADFGGWVEESRQHQDGWGETVNGKARFDVEKG